MMGHVQGVGEFIAEWCGMLVGQKGETELITSDFVLAKRSIDESYRRILECNDFLYKNMAEVDRKASNIAREVSELEYKRLGKFLFESIAKNNEAVNRKYLYQEIEKDGALKEMVECGALVVGRDSVWMESENEQ